MYENATYVYGYLVLIMHFTKNVICEHGIYCNKLTHTHAYTMEIKLVFKIQMFFFFCCCSRIMFESDVVSIIKMKNCTYDMKVRQTEGEGCCRDEQITIMGIGQNVNRDILKTTGVGNMYNKK